MIFNAEFDMLAPGIMESSITSEIRERYEQLFGQEKSVDHFSCSRVMSHGMLASGETSCITP